jgi:peroxiredoxin
LTIAVISRKSPNGHSPRAQKYELRDVLLDNDRKLNETYRVYGTPSAVIVSPNGKIVSSIAAGPEAIRTLAERVITTGNIVPVSQSGRSVPTVSREGIGPESRVPPSDFTWKSLDEQEITLSSLRGQSVILLFWNPSCGFCVRLLPDLRQWETAHTGDKPHIVIISAGTIAENAALGLRSPIVLDEEFATGRAFGVTGTPSALLIDPQGRISGEVAVGGPAVLATLNKREEVRT